MEDTVTFSIWKKISLFLSILLLIFLFLFYYSGYIEPVSFKINEYKVTNSLLPETFHGVKIVHISDLLYKTTYGEKEVKNMVAKINQIKPDIIVFTGDLFHKDITYTDEDYKSLETQLSKLDATIGKYIITGENDTNIIEWESVIKEAGFINLNNRYELLYHNLNDPIMIAGTSSNLNDTKTIEEKLEEVNKYISSIKSLKNDSNFPRYRILLLHEQDYIDRIDMSDYSLILSGHALGGNVRLPFIGGIINSKGSTKYKDSHTKINNTDLFISNGLGIKDIRYRFLNKPSVNLYRLTVK